jgi:hypothetical protein
MEHGRDERVLNSVPMISIRSPRLESLPPTLDLRARPQKKKVAFSEAETIRGCFSNVTNAVSFGALEPGTLSGGPLQPLGTHDVETILERQGT